MREYLDIQFPCELRPEDFTQEPSYEIWSQYSFDRAIIEIFGEAARLIKWINNEYDEEEIVDQWNTFAKLCAMTFASDTPTSGEKFELYHAYLDVRNFAFEDRARCKDGKTATKWFDWYMSEEHLAQEGLI